MSKEQLDWGKRWSKVVAKTWADEGFKKRLLGNPAAVLTEHGLEVSAGRVVHVVENSARALYLVLPAKPSEELSEEELEQVAGGAGGVRGVIEDPDMGGEGRRR